jgi:hypothetical protein
MRALCTPHARGIVRFSKNACTLSMVHGLLGRKRLGDRVETNRSTWGVPMQQGFARKVVPVAGLMLAVAAGPAQARDFYVDAAAGADTTTCVTSPGPGAPCRSISYVLNNTTLEGDTVHVRPGTYYENVAVGTSDGGSGESTRVRFVGEGGLVTLTGLDAAPLDDSRFVQCTAAVNCAGDGLAYPNTYRIDVAGRPAIVGVYELNWKPLRIDDSGVTNVVFDFTEPMQYKLKAGVAEVNRLSGSFWVSGTTLFVHTFFDENPATANLNLETRSRGGFGFAVSGSWVSVSNFVLRYYDSGFQISGDFVVADNIKVISGNGIGFDITSSSSDCTVTNVETSHVYRRKADDDSWVNYASGTGFNLKGTRHTIRGVTAWNSWNVFSGTMTNTLVEDAFVKNSPNHTFILSNTPGLDDCRDNTIKRSVAFNGQDQFFVRGCQNVVFLRNQGDIFLDDGAVTNNNDSTNWKARGNNLKRIFVDALSSAGFTSNYNWLDDKTGSHCRKADDIRNCGSPWQQLGYDPQSSYGAVLMANAPWPQGNGYETSKRTRADFAPLAGSGTIDRGDPDLDGDGVLENGPGGDDECTVAHHCAGAGPDIGPFEFGLSDPPPPPPDGPAAPANVQRGDTK